MRKCDARARLSHEEKSQYWLISELLPVHELDDPSGWVLCLLGFTVLHMGRTAGQLSNQ